MKNQENVRKIDKKIEISNKRSFINKSAERENGITLVALVVTIIVLLILAGVTISTLLGDNGIIRQSENVALKVRGSIVKEKIDIWKISKELGTEETERELLDSLENDKFLTPEEREELEQNRVIIIGGIESTLPVEGEINLKIEISDNVVELFGEKYVSPGSSYQIKLINEDTNEEINQNVVEWECTGEFASWNPGELTIDEYSLFGRTIEIRAKYKGQEAVCEVTTLSKLRLGPSDWRKVYYTNARQCSIFIYDRFWTNGKLNASILPGESGYAILYDPADWGRETAASHLIERTNIKQDGIQFRPVTEIPSPGSFSYYHEISVGAGWSGLETEIPLRMSLSVKGSSGEILIENQQVDPNGIEPILLTTNTEMPNWSEVRVDYSFPSWGEMTDDEKMSVLYMMRLK